MNHQVATRSVGIATLACLMVLPVGSVCNAQGREGRAEVALIGNWLGGESETIDDFTVAEDDWFLYGIQLGWNATDHLNINTDFLYGSIDVAGSGSVLGRDFVAKGDQDTFVWMVNLDYNILAEPLTPFVMAGLGLGYSSGDATVETDDRVITTSDSSTGFAWNLGAGGRWDVTDNLFVKVYYRIIWDDESDDRDGVAFSVGWMF